MDTFGEAVDNYKDDQIVMIRGKSSDEVEGEILPGKIRHWKGAQQSHHLLGFIFGVLAIYTLSHELCYVVTKARSTKNFRYASYYFCDALMSTCRGRVILSE